MPTMKEFLASFLQTVKLGAQRQGLDGLASSVDMILGSDTLMTLLAGIVERYTPLDASASAEAQAVALSEEEQCEFDTQAIDIGQVVAIIRLLLDLWKSLPKQ